MEANPRQQETPLMHVFEDISLGTNATQVIGSPSGKVIQAKKITVESGAAQCLGDYSEETVQKVIINHREANPPTNPSTPSSDFERQHGNGHILGSSPSTA
ncbi:hypothetical protein EIK77_000190 [Talaromyces pinophilus]|nr:hypothetical protein EIK77_000190 [Talaromyces pinophilus]